MKKILKIIKSRYMLSALIILLEFVQLMFVFDLLFKYSHVMLILGYMFYIGVFVYIVNKYKSPEFKLPWIIIIMLFFVLGAFAFMLLTSNSQSEKIISKFNNNKEKRKKYLQQDDTLEKIKEDNLDFYLQANYVTKAAELPVYKNTKVTYYKTGEEFYEELLDALSSAKSFIFMEYFIIEEGKMWNQIYNILKDKVKSGVEVYVMYDDVGCMMTLDSNYYMKLNENGIKCIPSNKFMPILSNIHNNRDHRKITVVDGLVGFTGGINLADEYINAKVKYGHWKDSAIKLEGEAVRSLTALFLEIWNTQNKKELDQEKFLKQDSKKINTQGIVIPYGDGPKEFYNEDIGKYIYLNMINASKKYIYITTPYLICDYELLNSLCMCAKKGVDVRIITPHIPDKKLIFWMTQSNYDLLIKSGVKIYEYTPGFIHSKEFICDDIYATCGTINLDYRSLVHHFECGVLMYNTKCIKDMKDNFLETLKLSEEVTDYRKYIGRFKKIVAEVVKIFSPLM